MPPLSLVIYYASTLPLRYFSSPPPFAISRRHWEPRRRQDEAARGQASRFALLILINITTPFIVIDHYLRFHDYFITLSHIRRHWLFSLFRFRYIALITLASVSIIFFFYCFSHYFMPSPLIITPIRWYAMPWCWYTLRWCHIRSLTPLFHWLFRLRFSFRFSLSDATLIVAIEIPSYATDRWPDFASRLRCFAWLLRWYFDLRQMA